MGKGKGKKGKRGGGKPGPRPPAAKRPETAVAEQPAGAVAAPPADAAVAVAPGPASRPSAVRLTAAADSSSGERTENTPAWQMWLKAIGTRLGIYALMLLGAYCLLIGLFSPWGFNIWDTGRKPAWGVVWLALGGGLFYAGWYLSAPEAKAGSQADKKGQRGRR